MGRAMYEPISRAPICRKCERPMTWHSDQQVNSGSGQQTMHVFECDTCGRFCAVAVVGSKAA